MRDAFRRACSAHLDAWGIPWRISHRLVRGLDYYTRTTFEILGETLGAQNALLGGGRYDGLVKESRRARSDRASALPPASSGWCWRCRKARRWRRTPRAFVVAIGDDGRAEGAASCCASCGAPVWPAQMEFEARGVKCADEARRSAAGAR